MKEVSKFTFFMLYISLFLAASVFLISAVANAYDVPKDAVIKVYTKDGKQIGEMSRKNYKVVKIEEKKIDVRPTGKTIIVEKTPEKVESKYKLSLVLGGGVGNDGHNVDNNGSYYHITDRQRAIGTAGGCLTKDGAGVCLTGSTNDTYQMNFLIPLTDVD